MSLDLLIPEMVPIPAGTFIMGTPQDPFENSQTIPNGPRYKVTIRSFSISKYPVTQEQWFELMGVNPSTIKGRRRPVTNISWNECQEYLRRLSQATGKNYRLPSECEWEYVSREGLEKEFPYPKEQFRDYITPWPEGVSISAGVLSTYPGVNEDVGRRKPNRWGVHDMFGLVGQFMQDCWNKDYVGAPDNQTAWMSGDCSSHVMRGAFLFELVSRAAIGVNSKNHFVGLRIASDQPLKQAQETNHFEFITSLNTPSFSVHNQVTGRNELCPCGSGNKYKFCHGKLS